MRLFIAIQFNDEIIEALNELQEDLRDQGMEGHYSPLENLHLTLAFIGEYGDPEEVMEHRFFGKSKLPDDLNRFDRDIILEWAEGKDNIQ